MSPREVAARRVAKLLALAIDQRGKPEGRAAQDQAERLMAKHGLEAGDVKGPAPEALVVERIDVGGRGELWRQTLFDAAARVAGVAAAFVSGSPRRGVASGRRCDVEVARYLYAALDAQRREAELTYRDGIRVGVTERFLVRLGRRPTPAEEDELLAAVFSQGEWAGVMRRWRRDYARGVSYAASNLLAERAAAAAREESTALVLASRLDVAERHLEAAHTVWTAPPRATGGEVNYAAIAAGARARFSPGIDEGAPPARLRAGVRRSG